MKSYSSCLSDDGFVIFLFHGVIYRQRHTVRNYTRKHLPVEYFDAVLCDLCAHGTPVSMRDIAAGVDLPPKAFAVTFDDGFENNFSIAAPVLRGRSVPATFYVTTGFIGTGALSWIDEIECVFELCRTVAVKLPEACGETRASSPNEKKALLDRIRAEAKTNAGIDPYEFASAVRRHNGVDAMDSDSELDSKMSWEQVAELGRDPLFVVGGHSHTHRILSMLASDALENEVAESIRLLEGHLKAPVHHYSYPEGLGFSYSDDVIACLKRHNVRCSPTAIDGVNHRGDDLFHLKRILVL